MSASHRPTSVLSRANAAALAAGSGRRVSAWTAAVAKSDRPSAMVRILINVSFITGRARARPVGSETNEGGRNRHRPTVHRDRVAIVLTELRSFVNRAATR